MTVDQLVATAVAAQADISRRPVAWRAEALRQIAEMFVTEIDEVIEVADAETGLGVDRLRGEHQRTVGQLELFADVVDEGAFLDLTIDTARSDTTPPRPDVRRTMVPLGPVAVFEASNFPLAFGVPGNDTAAALAAGCAVVVKAHPLHIRTAELCHRLVVAGIEKSGGPDGAVGLLLPNREEAQKLVLHPDIAAVGFTGSLGGGRAIFDLAASRPRPIPVYAEMGSLNPTVVTDAALAARGEAIAGVLAGSVTMSTGQLCTKPGLVFVPDGEQGDSFVSTLATQIAERDLGPMLGKAMRDAFVELAATRGQRDGVRTLAAGEAGGAERATSAAVFEVSAGQLTRDPELLDEHFGPGVLLVRYADTDAVTSALSVIEGSLAAAIFAEATDTGTVQELLDVLRDRSGRIVFDAAPTGVAVISAMHHGGPYPATTSPLYTSIGPAAVRRFIRPVAYQGAADELLPVELRDANPLQLVRLIDGQRTAEPVRRTA